jgi:hypothetical protein
MHSHPHLADTIRKDIMKILVVGGNSSDGLQLMSPAVVGLRSHGPLARVLRRVGYSG